VLNKITISLPHNTLLYSDARSYHS